MKPILRAENDVSQAVSSPAHREVALPLIPLVLTAIMSNALVAGLWTIGVFTLGATPPALACGLAAAGLVAIASISVILLIQPWSPKPLYRWPAVWIGGSFLRMGVTLGMAYLLYSATPLRDRLLWFAVVACYFATLVGETRTFAKLMKRIAPPGAPPSASE